MARAFASSSWDVGSSARRTAGCGAIARAIATRVRSPAAKKILRLIDALEENDDVQDVYSNFDIPERVLEAVAT